MIILTQDILFINFRCRSYNTFNYAFILLANEKLNLYNQWQKITLMNVK